MSYNPQYILIIALLFFSTQIHAQPRTGKAIDVSIGYGISAPTDDVDITGEGFYLQGEYVIGLTKWFGFRPYAGLILTSSDEEENTGFKSTANAFLLGGKARVLAPIPWVAPYIEVGVGVSFGSFETMTPFTNVEKSGVLYHIPFTLGLAVGPRSNIDVELVYYYHPSADQFSGAAALGVSIPLAN